MVGLQASRNGESLLARDMEEGVRLARENSQSGVRVRLEGEARPWNPRRHYRRSARADGLPDATGTQPAETVPPEVLAQQAREAEVQRELDKACRRGGPRDGPQRRQAYRKGLTSPSGMWCGYGSDKRNAL